MKRQNQKPKKQKCYGLNNTNLDMLKTCRTCVSPSSNIMFCLFTTEGRDLCREMLFCLGLQVKEGDGLPAKICESCLKKLHLVHTFKSQCLAAETLLKKQIQWSVKTEPYSNSQIMINDNQIMQNYDHIMDCDKDITYNDDPIADNVSYTTNKPVVDIKMEPVQSGHRVPNNGSSIDKYEDFKDNHIKKEIHYTKGLDEILVANKTKFYPDYCKDSEIRQERRNRGPYRKRVRPTVLSDDGSRRLKFRRLYCEACDLKFSSKEESQAHKIQLHQDAERWTCEYCGKKGDRRMSYYAHRRRHELKMEAEFQKSSNSNEKPLSESHNHGSSTLAMPKYSDVEQYASTKTNDHPQTESGHQQTKCGYQQTEFGHEQTECDHQETECGHQQTEYSQETESGHQQIESCQQLNSLSPAVDDDDNYIDQFDVFFKNNNFSVNKSWCNRKYGESKGLNDKVHMNGEKITISEDAVVKSKTCRPPAVKRVRKKRPRLNQNFCEQCGIKFQDSEHFLTHKRDVHNFNYLCEICGKLSHNRSAQYTHSLIHKPPILSCDICDYKSARKTDLIKHIHIHTGVRNYICDHCPASFTTASNLMKHRRAHAAPPAPRTHPPHAPHRAPHGDQMRYFCKICGASFYRHYRLAAHVRGVHRAPPPARPRPGRRRLDPAAAPHRAGAAVL